jgi:multiple sugar transport system ATP-binding protein
MAGVTLQNVFKRYGTVEAVRGIDLAIADHQFVALVGPSGCGKTTTLRMIAGLEDISGGEIDIGGRVINNVAPKDRDIAMVFQSYALYPHMTVFENMAFGLKLRGLSRADIRARVEDAARILELGQLLERRPKALSGGQRQRVAMGRAIVRNPQVFLFDEPLSNLDAKLRVQMRAEIKKIHQTVRTTTVYVTHDQVEALTLADLVVVMNRGAIEQVGTPQEVYRSPRTRFVAGFMGSPAMNFFDVRLEAGAIHLPGEVTLALPPARAARYRHCTGRPMLLGLRPEHIHEDGGGQLPATVEVVEPMGAETSVVLRLGDAGFTARFGPDTAVQAGNTIRLRFDLEQMHLIDPATDLVL